MKKTLLSDRALIVYAFIFSVIILFSNLGNDGMYAPQEGRTAIIVRNMLLSGNYLDMVVEHGIPYEKPVGHYWMCLPFGAAFGLANDPMTVSVEWALRLPSALSALLALFAVCVMAYRMYNARTAALAVTVLGSMMYFVHLGRLAHIDMPLAASFACTMMFFYLGYLEKLKANFMIYGFYAFLGWGLVLKGPLVVILAGLTIAALMCVMRRWKMIWEIRPLTGGLVFLAVGLPWYIVEHIRTDGAFFDEFIMKQNISRFTGVNSTYRDGERMSYFYYIPKLTANAAPWSILAIIALLAYFKRLARLRFSPSTLFLLMWFVTGFVFFSLSALKRGDYLLPLYPALAILVAASIDRFLVSPPSLPRWWIYVWGAVCAAFALVAASAFTPWLSNYLRRVTEGGAKGISKRDAMNMLNICDFMNGHVFLVVLFILLVSGILFALGRLLEKRMAGWAFGIVCGVIMSFYLVFYGVIEPRADVKKSVKPFIREARGIIPAGADVSYYSNFNTELIFFMSHPYDVSVRDDIMWMMTDRGGLRELEKQGRLGDWIHVKSTEDGHFYPVILMKRKSPGEN